jgi:SPP1 gp7 family putative phage head morphogenesis protein
MGKVCCVNKAIDTEDFYGPDTNEIRFGRRLASAFKTASSELVGAWDSLDPQTAEQAYQAILRLPWQESFGAFQTEWEESTREVMTEAGERSFRDLRGRVATTTSTLFTTAFTVENPYSRVYIRERSSKLIVQITDETREAVKEILDRAIRDGYPPKEIRNVIGNTVGLFDRWANAVYNKRSMYLKDGMSLAEADAAAAKYSNKLIRRRGENIARTEIVSASNQGTLDSWKIAQDNQWIPSDSKKEWIAGFGSARTCPYCSALHGTIVGVNEMFPDTGIGRSERPPLHPSCRCTIGLVFED